MYLTRHKGRDGSTYWYVRTRGKVVAPLGNGLTPDEARKRLRQLEREAHDADLGYAAKDATLAEFAEEKWLPLARTKRPKTFKRYEGTYRVYVKPMFGATGLRRVTVEAVEAWLIELRASKGPWVARHAFAVLHGLLKTARRYGRVSRNVAADVDPGLHAPPRTSALPASLVLSVDELCTVLRAAPRGMREAILTAALCGLRWGEMAALAEADVNLDLRPASGYGVATIRVERQRPANENREDAPKSAAGIRTVDVPWPVRHALLDVAPHGGRFFTAPHGGPLHHKDHSRVFRDLLERLGLRTPARRLRWHSLRHFFCSLLLSFGRTPHYVAAQAGHSSTKLTWDVYGHLVAATGKLDERKVMRQLWEAYSGQTGRPTPTTGKARETTTR